jgi:hypothetical protein
MMMADLKPYPAMKDSGVESLGEVSEALRAAANQDPISREGPA